MPDDDERRPVVDFGDAKMRDVRIENVAGRDINIHQAPLTSEQRQAQRNRAALLELVRRFWVEGVLHASLHQQVRLELGLQARPEAVEHPWQNIVRLPDAAPALLSSGRPLREVFTAAGGRLLILGAPGGGKTTMLLTLAEQLLEDARTDAAQPIPVVFQLSTWAIAKPPLAAWLVTELKERYKVPPKVGKAWVEAGEILPLLDGLDEVGPGDAERAACVGAMNTYLGESGAQAAVCSRSAEYAQAGAKLALEAALEVQPLDAGQVDAYLARIGPPLAGLRAAVASNATLGELAVSPLLLSVMALTYHDVPVAELAGQGQERAHRRLWDDYLANRLAVVRANAKTAPKQLRAWLIWLARGMIKHEQQTFYIENLQPSWLASRRQRREFLLFSSLAVGFADGVGFGFFVSLGFGPLVGLIFGLLSGLVVSIISGAGYIRLTETLSWNWNRALTWQRIGEILPLSIGIGIVSSIAISLGLALFINLISSITFGLIFGLGISLGLSLVVSVLEGDEVEISVRPNEGIIRSLSSAWRGGLVVGLVIGLVVGLIGGLSFGLGFGLGAGLTGGLSFGLAFGFFRYGGATVIKHFILRILLASRRHAPWNFADALDEAVSRTLMTRVGGGYRFSHRLLQEHLAEHTSSDLPIAPILGPQEGDRAIGRRAQG